MKKLTAPEPNIRYSFRMPNGNRHSFVYYGKNEKGRLLFINTTYGTLTSMTPARFSFMFAKFPKELSPYILEEHYPATKAQVQSKESERLERQRQEDAQRKAESDKQFQTLIYKLKTLPIDVEYTVNKELGINVHQIASEIESEQNFNLYTADIVLKLVNLLKGTPYALPAI